MSESELVTNPTLESFARALGFRSVPGASATGGFQAVALEPIESIHNRIEDAELDADMDKDRNAQEQRRAAKAEANQPDPRN